MERKFTIVSYEHEIPCTLIRKPVWLDFPHVRNSKKPSFFFTLTYYCLNIFETMPEIIMLGGSQRLCENGQKCVSVVYL